MKRNIIVKLISILFSLICILSVLIPAYAANTAQTVKKTEVLFICKVSNDIKTDEYSTVVVKILNEDTSHTSTYYLYEYNNFTEHYVLENGRYSIIYAYIVGRNDIIFDIKADRSFEIGHTNSIYFELINSGKLGDGETTTKKTTTTKTTTTKKPVDSSKETELHTLFPILTTGSDKTEENTLKTQKHTEPSQTNTDITTTHTNDEQTIQTKLSRMFIVMAIIIVVIIIILIVIYAKKKKE